MSDWTVDTLKSLLEAMLSDVTTQIRELKEAMEKQTQLAREGESKRQQAHEVAHEREHQAQVAVTDKTERTLKETLAGLERQINTQFDGMKDTYHERTAGVEASIVKAEQFVNARFSEVEKKIEAASAKSEASVLALRAELVPQIVGELRRGDRDEGKGEGTKLVWAAVGVIAGLGLSALALFKFS